MKAHHTKEKGDLGVLKAQLDLFQKGYLIPNSEHCPFDLVVYKMGNLKEFRLNIVRFQMVQ